jgi:hypothetical protein
MVLRKAAVALLIQRIIANSRWWKTGSSKDVKARIRALLLKYPLLVSMISFAEQFALVLLQHARSRAAHASAAVTSNLRLDALANSRFAQAPLQFLKTVANTLFQIMFKFDAALKTLAPFARYRIVCSVMRSKRQLLPRV